jgi:hypothetical protein
MRRQKYSKARSPIYICQKKSPINLKRLDDLPPLAELAQLEPVELQLELEATDEELLRAEASEAVDAEVEAGESPNINGEVEAAEQSDGVADGDTVDESGNADAAGVGFEDEDDDEPVSDDEIEAAAARIAQITAELAGDAEAHEAQDLPPGAVAPLVALHAPGEEVAEPATVASLDEARAAAADRSADSAALADDADEGDQQAEVVPLKTP